MGCAPRTANEDAESGGAGNAGVPTAGASGRSGAAGMGGTGASRGGTSGTTGGRGHGGNSGSSGSSGDTSVGGAGEGGEDNGGSGAGPLGGSGGTAGRDDGLPGGAGGEGGEGGEGGDGVGGAGDPGEGGDGAGGAGDEGADLAIRQFVQEYYLVGRATWHEVRVENRGSAPSHGTVTVENLPNAFAATQWIIPGQPSPWICETIAGVLTCSLTEPIAAASAAPVLWLSLTANNHEGSPLENTVTVRNEADTHPENDRSTALLTVHRPVDLAIGMFFPAYSTSATVTVTNVGDAPTFSRVSLFCGGYPVSFVSMAFPDTRDWTCGADSVFGTLCSRMVPLAPGAWTSIQMDVSSRIAPEGYLSCELGTEGDVNSDNNEIAMQGGSRT